ncbi:hypothetical protein T11_15584 [Trichinella zimbabwensis]|uniref:PiggyBac transposable element-derived protein domain-containing protein n=1 Tax=Trichinella zimbabwensis TaxID=268475 RepID=A0A0V1GPM6_9BILA|nr:hypothetical protein T11_15584 [Trichinella zimbabwensis]
MGNKNQSSGVAVWKFSVNQTSEIAERWFPDLLNLSVAVWNIRQLTHLWQMHVNPCGRNLLDAISNRISRNRFIEILQYSHFNDNNKTVADRSDPSYDQWFKIRPLLHLFLARTLSATAICAKKPQKSSFKVFARCGVSGFLCDFLTSDGKHSTEEVTAANKPYEVVLKSCESLPAHKTIRYILTTISTFWSSKFSSKNVEYGAVEPYDKID